MLYLASTWAGGRAPGVSFETTIIISAETIVIGTTGSRPSTVVPEATRVTIGVAPNDSSATLTPGGGGATADWITATATTAAAVHSVVASAPHLVLFFQKSAAINSGDRAA